MNQEKDHIEWVTNNLNLGMDDMNLKQIQLNPERIHMAGESGKLKLGMNNLYLKIIHLNQAIVFFIL